MHFSFHPLSANPTKWSNTLKQFIGNLRTNCLSVFDHFVILALKGLILILLIFFQSLKVVLINMVPILMMSAKLVTLGLPKIKVI